MSRVVCVTFGWKALAIYASWASFVTSLIFQHRATPTLVHKFLCLKLTSTIRCVKRPQKYQHSYSKVKPT